MDRMGCKEERGDKGDRKESGPSRCVGWDAGVFPAYLILPVADQQVCDKEDQHRNPGVKEDIHEMEAPGRGSKDGMRSHENDIYHRPVIVC